MAATLLVQANYLCSREESGLDILECRMYNYDSNLVGKYERGGEKEKEKERRKEK